MDLVPSGVSAAAVASATALSVASIDNPATELNAIAGVVKGECRLAYQTIAATDDWTLYAWDDASSIASSTPYTCSGTSGMWVAVAGKYRNGVINILSPTNTSINVISTLAQSSVGGSSLVLGCNDGSPMTSGNKLGTAFFRGIRSGTTFNTSVSIEAFATESWTNTAAGSKCVLSVVPNGTVTRVASLTLDQDLSATQAGALNVVSGLSVSGTTTLTKSLTCSSGASIVSTLSVSGATTISSPTTINGSTGLCFILNTTDATNGSYMLLRNSSSSFAAIGSAPGAAGLGAISDTAIQATAGSLYLIGGSQLAVQLKTISGFAHAGFFGATPIAQPVDGATLTNNVASGGTTNTIANFTDLTIYANDSAAIRNDIYQLARKVKIITDNLRSLGLET